MLKFHQIILRKFLLLFLALFLIIGTIVYYWTYESYLESTKRTLLQDIELISYTVDTDTDFDLLAQNIKKNLRLRLTIINFDGTVIAESDEDKHLMGNHRYRPEILQSDTQNYGFIIRDSKTVNKKMLYVAKKIISNKQTLYIRLSKEVKGIYSELINLGIKISAVLIIFFIILLIMSYKINAQIQHETNKIALFLKALTKKDKPTFITSRYSQEFALITSLLTKVSQILAKKDKQKAKYTKRLQASNQQKDDIISAISHEFKNPIAVVNGYSQTLLDDDNLNIAIRKKFLTKIYNNGIKLSNLINTLRLSMKLDGGELSMRLVEVNICELAKDCAKNLQLSYPHRKVIFEGDEDAKAKMDETLFSIVITNLIENAFKYSEDEVHIIISKKQIEIKDSGIGINENDLKNITKKFYRVHTNSWNNSLGLGLFLVNNIIQLHNFKLSIKSKPNEGSSFIIEFQLSHFTSKSSIERGFEK